MKVKQISFPSLDGLHYTNLVIAALHCILLQVLFIVQIDLLIVHRFPVNGDLALFLLVDIHL